MFYTVNDKVKFGEIKPIKSLIKLEIIIIRSKLNSLLNTYVETLKY